MKRKALVVILICCVVCLYALSRDRSGQGHEGHIVPVYVYIHVCCIGRYAEILGKLLASIKSSGLYDRASEIRCCVIGEYDPGLFRDPVNKVRIHATSADVSLYEAFTLNVLRADASRARFNALYLHTKGVTRATSAPVASWVDYMLHFCVRRYALCTALLGAYDTVGVNLHPEPVLHYSGNFWWATSRYIASLAACTMAHYNSPEFWLTEGRTGRHASLWESGINHYEKTYSPLRYRGAYAAYA